MSAEKKSSGTKKPPLHAPGAPFAVVHPSGNGSVHYENNGMGLENVYVCNVDGTVPWDRDWMFGGIFVANRSSQFILPNNYTAADVVAAINTDASCVQCDFNEIDTTNQTWSFGPNSPKVAGFLDLDGNGDPIDTYNWMAAVAYYADGIEECPLNPYQVFGPFRWTAQPTENGPAIKLPPKTSPALAQVAGKCDYSNHLGTSRSTILMQQDVCPIEVQDGWLRYSLRLSVGLPSKFRLLHHGCCHPPQPLRANEIVVSVPHLHWRPTSTSPFAVTQPFGSLERIDNLLVRFTRHPKFALVLYQESGWLTVLTSQCRECPQRVTLLPTRDIILQLNDFIVSQYDNTGVIDLWVKVAD